MNDIYAQLTGGCFDQFSALIKSLASLINTLWQTIKTKEASIQALTAELEELKVRLEQQNVQYETEVRDVLSPKDAESLQIATKAASFRTPSLRPSDASSSSVPFQMPNISLLDIGVQQSQSKDE